MCLCFASKKYIQKSVVPKTLEIKPKPEVDLFIIYKENQAAPEISTFKSIPVGNHTNSIQLKESQIHIYDYSYRYKG